MTGPGEASPPSSDGGSLQDEPESGEQGEAARLLAAFPEAGLSDAEARLLAGLERDLARVLGAGVAIEVVERAPDGSVRLVAACLVEGRIGEIEAGGRDLPAAARALVGAAAERRLDGVFWQIVGPAG